MSSHLAELIDALPEGVVVTDPERIEKYRWDRSQDPDTGTPAAVVRVQDAGQVQTAVRWAAAHRVPVVPRGAGRPYDRSTMNDPASTSPPADPEPQRTLHRPSPGWDERC